MKIGSLIMKFLAAVLIVYTGLQPGYSQTNRETDNFVILKDKTRIYGDHVRWIWGIAQGGRVRLTNGSNVQHFEFKDLQYFVKDGAYYRVLKVGDGDDNRDYIEARLFTRGHISLYDLDYDDANFDWYVLFEDKAALLRRKAFRELLTPYLMTCPDFKAQFGRKKLRYRHLIRYVSFYNVRCAEDPPSNY